MLHGRCFEVRGRGRAFRDIAATVERSGVRGRAREQVGYLLANCDRAEVQGDDSCDALQREQYCNACALLLDGLDAYFANVHIFANSTLGVSVPECDQQWPSPNSSLSQ